MTRLLWILLLLVTFIEYSSCGTSPEAAAAIDRIRSYDKRIRPNEGVKPTEVTCSAWIIRAYDYCNKNNDFKVEMYFRQSWEDPRLKYAEQGTLGKDEKFYGDHRFLEKIWIPDTFFSSDRMTGSNGKHEMTVPNVFIRISPNGTVFYSQRITTRAQCSEDTSSTKFPFDHRQCNVSLESYGFSIRDLTFKWKMTGNNGKPVGLGSKLPGFRMDDPEIWSKTLYLSQTDSTYEIIGFKINIRRISCGYWTRNILPSIVVVLLSFIPVLRVKKNKSIGLPFLSFICFLSQLLLTIQAKNALPEVTSSLDTFNLASLLVTGLGVLWVAFSPSTSKGGTSGEAGTSSSDTEKQLMNGDPAGNNDKPTTDETSTEPKKNRAKDFLSKFGSYLIPLIYVVFHFFFWILL